MQDCCLRVIFTVCRTPLDFQRYPIDTRGGDRFAVCPRADLYHTVGVGLPP